MTVIVKYKKNGYYVKEIRTFKRKNIKYYLFILKLKIKHKYYEVLNNEII